ncbi:MAG: hypothetical protein ACT4OQ_03460 [Chloroflexota bacterium]
MPTPLILIGAAVAFVVILCVVLWIIAEATGGPNADHTESRH